MKLQFHNTKLNPPKKDGVYLCYCRSYNEVYLARASFYVTKTADWSYCIPKSAIQSAAKVMLMDLIEKRKKHIESKSDTEKRKLNIAFDSFMSELMDFVLEENYDNKIDEIAPQPDFWCEIPSVIFSSDFELEIDNMDEFEVTTTSMELAGDIAELTSAAIFSALSKFKQKRDYVKEQPWMK